MRYNHLDPENSLLSFIKRTLFFLLTCMLGFIFLNTCYIMIKHRETIPVSTHSQKNNNLNSVTGIHLTHHYKEQKIFSIQAKTASIKNKKIGFFRIGGLKQLELENMIVDYFEPSNSASVMSHKEARSREKPFDLFSHFSKASHSIPLLKKDLAGFVAHYATIRYHHPDALMTIVNAPFMELHNDRKSLHFQKNVAVHFQKKILLCNRLIFDTRRSRIITHKKYTLINDGVIHKGKGVRMNLRLDVLP